ncbi:hypothetical protein OH76DRAFT_1422827 [Lentinus brumalis]|uniref:BTB domain-containing protein n=1 Tax=Lentinus brumalis TaxID=2498619 RepID=A0A371CNU8_9APHY|nr:hypothetical protein OH76DRAFT_1422827 [Polyporus brumalis]
MSASLDRESEDRPSKRPRHESEAPVPAASLSFSTIPEVHVDVVRDSEFWLLDGNVVLIAQKSAFRVHQSVLARHSTVLADLFTVPLPPSSDARETMDGCPVVQLHDSPDDLRYLLKALYDGPRMLHHGTVMPFPTAAALYELAHKYNIESIRSDVHARLKTCFTHSFSVFKSTLTWKMERPDTVLPGTRAEWPVALCSPALEADIKRDAIRAVNLAHLSGDPLMLPIPLYLCAMLPSASIASGIKRADVQVDNLSKEDQIRCFDGRATFMLRRVKRYGRTWLVGPSAQCHDPVCQTVFNGWVKSHLGRRDFPGDVHALRHIPPSKLEHSRLCQECHRDLVRRDLEEHRYIWEKLPTDLGLNVQGWDASLPGVI